ITRSVIVNALRKFERR
ncbi:MAG: hypothetical protein HFE60_06285, partial [Anaerotignum sp.]|nr:hypothetical protein [Anaerotignum sp.]